LKIKRENKEERNANKKSGWYGTFTDSFKYGAKVVSNVNIKEVYNSL